jgi:hypothetical protein
MADPVIPTENLIADLNGLAMWHGHPPKVPDYREFGKFAYSTVNRRLGADLGWPSTLTAAGLNPDDRPSTVTKSDIIEDIQQVATELGHPPRSREYNTHGNYDLYTCFDTIDAALDAAGLEPNDRPTEYGTPIPEILNDISTVADKIGHPPRHHEWDEHGTLGPWAVVSHDEYDNWDEWLEAAGLDPSKKPSDKGGYRISLTELLNDFDRVAEDLGRPPRPAEYDELGDYSRSTLRRRVDINDWNSLVAELGYDPDEIKYLQADRELPKLPGLEETIEALQELADELGFTPRIQDFEAHTDWTFAQIQRAYSIDSWLKFIGLANLDPTQKPGRIDGTSPTTRALVADVNIVAKQLGAAPSREAYADLGLYSPSTFAQRFDLTWPMICYGLGWWPRGGQFQSEIPDGILLANLAAVVKALGRPLVSSSEYERIGHYSRHPYNRAFGGIDEALKQFDDLEILCDSSNAT